MEVEKREAEELSRRFEFALRIGREAGQLVMKYFLQPVDVDRKSDDSPVTIADREAELYMRREIEAAFPEDGIIGEEFPSVDGVSEYRWILDPIDGTKTFIFGAPLFGTLIAVQRRQQSVLGLIELPALKERVYARIGGGAWHQDCETAPKPAHVSCAQQLAEGLYVTTETESFLRRSASEVHRTLESSSWLARTWGDCYGYFMVATGRALTMVDPVMSLWDAAALLPILAEAGGTFTDWAGNVTVDGGEGIATNAHVLDEVLRITRPFANAR